MKKLKIGVLGVSNHFVKRIVLPLQKTEYCYIHGIASRNQGKAEAASKKYNIPKSYGSYEELLADKDVDAVYIPLPNYMHAEWIMRSADAGKHILCEKPLCMNAGEASKALGHAAEKGVRLMEAFMYKFHPMWQHVKDIVRTNQIGKVTNIHVSFFYNNPSKTNIRNIKEYGGGAMMDIGCYAVSVPRFVFDSEPSRVVSLITSHPGFGTDMLSSAVMDFGEGRATFSVGTLSEAHQRVEIIGTSGKISVPLPFNTFVDVGSSIIVTNNIGERVVEFPAVDQYGVMFDAFAKAVLNDEEVPVGVDDAVKNQKVVDAVFRSGMSEKWESVI